MNRGSSHQHLERIWKRQVLKKRRQDLKNEKPQLKKGLFENEDQEIAIEKEDSPSSAIEVRRGVTSNSELQINIAKEILVGKDKARQPQVAQMSGEVIGASSSATGNQAHATSLPNGKEQKVAGTEFRSIPRPSEQMPVGAEASGKTAPPLPLGSRPACSTSEINHLCTGSEKVLFETSAAACFFERRYRSTTAPTGLAVATAMQGSEQGRLIIRIVEVRGKTRLLIHNMVMSQIVLDIALKASMSFDWTVTQGVGYVCVDAHPTIPGCRFFIWNVMNARELIEALEANKHTRILWTMPPLFQKVVKGGEAVRRL